MKVPLGKGLDQAVGNQLELSSSSSLREEEGTKGKAPCQPTHQTSESSGKTVRNGGENDSRGGPEETLSSQVKGMKPQEPRSIEDRSYLGVRLAGRWPGTLRLQGEDSQIPGPDEVSGTQNSPGSGTGQRRGLMILTSGCGWRSRSGGRCGVLSEDSLEDMDIMAGVRPWGSWEEFRGKKDKPEAWWREGWDLLAERTDLMEEDPNNSRERKDLGDEGPPDSGSAAGSGPEKDGLLD